MNDGGQEPIQHPWVSLYAGTTRVRLSREDVLLEDVGHVLLQQHGAEVLQVGVVKPKCERAAMSDGAKHTSTSSRRTRASRGASRNSRR